MYSYRYIITLCIASAMYCVVGEHDAKESYFNDVVRRTLAATAHNCMDHASATIDDLEKLQQEPPYPEKSACIVKCLLEKIGVLKSNKYSKTGFMAAVTPLVFANKKKLEHMRTVSENCDREVNHKHETPCQIGNEVIECIYRYAPELHLKS